MVTHYGDLITTARANLATALLRQHHPSAARQPAVPLPAYLADFADALAHLGATVGDTGRADLGLLRALRALARVDLDPTGHDQTEPRGPELDLAEATIAVRVAADLIGSHGPDAEQLTARELAHEWATPRPEHLTTPSARQGAWTQIADLATLTAALVGPEADPLLDDAAQRVADTAAAVPRHSPSPAVLSTGPAWPLPLPRHAVPDEWAGRLEELTALAWRMTVPPASGRAHPITGLRLIAETGHQLHNQAAKTATDPATRHALQHRAELWRDIHHQLHALHTPTEPLMPAQRFALMRTRALAVAPLNPGDLIAGRTALTQAASWAQTTLGHYLDNPVVGLGPTLTPQLRAPPHRISPTRRLERSGDPPPRGRAAGQSEPPPGQPHPRGCPGPRDRAVPSRCPTPHDSTHSPTRPRPAVGLRPHHRRRPSSGRPVNHPEGTTAMTATKPLSWANSTGTLPGLLRQTRVRAVVHLPRRAADGVPRASGLR